MKKLLMFVSLAVAGYWAWAHYGGHPVLAEIRIRIGDTGIELVGLGKMNSEADCRDRAERVWSKVFSANPKLVLASVKCAPSVSPRLQGLFDKREFQATYLSFEKGNSGERDGRFIFFGVPSSEVGKFCPSLIQGARQNYSGKVECVLGTVG